MELKSRIEKEFLPLVIKPGQYIGNELGGVRHTSGSRTRFVIALPRPYEAASTDFNLQRLYGWLNGLEAVSAERVFLPGQDAQKLLRGKKIPLFSLESFRALSDFDCLIFLSDSPLQFPYILLMLNLGDVPVFSSKREQRPLLFGAGSAFANPEPMLEFMDGFILDLSQKIITSFSKSISSQAEKKNSLQTLSELAGVYIPGFGYQQANTTVVRDMKNKAELPQKPVVPYVEVDHDKLGVGEQGEWISKAHLADDSESVSAELFSENLLVAMENTGFETIKLDFSRLAVEPRSLIQTLEKKIKDRRYAYEFESLPLDSIDPEICDILGSTGRNKISFQILAPSQRLRDWIGQGLTEDVILTSLETVLERDFQLLGASFILGLPTETSEDLRELGRLLTVINEIYSKSRRGKNFKIDWGCFYPVPNSIWQWDQINSFKELEEKIFIVRQNSRTKKLKLAFPNLEEEFWKAIFLRGDRKLGQVIQQASQKLAQAEPTENGALDWGAIFQNSGLNPTEYARAFKLDQPLPWDYLISAEAKEKLVSARASNPAARPTSNQTVTPVKQSCSTKKEQWYGRRVKVKPFISSLSPSHSKIRLKWIKSEKVRYTSHLDVVRMFEKAVRRADFPVGYSEGFHPHPKIAYGPPLPLGFVSECEYLDLQLEAPFNYQLIDKLNSALPEGFRIVEARPVFIHSVSLSAFINTSVYEVELEELKGDQVRVLVQLPRQGEVLVSRRSKTGPKAVNLAGLIHKIQVENRAGKSVVKTWLGLGQEGYARPQEVLQFALQMSEEELSGLVIKRVDLFCKKGDQYLSPLQVL